MPFPGPVGMSISSSQFRLKYPKTRLNVPSAFCSQPSNTGTTSCPVEMTCALARGNAANATRTLHAAKRRSEVAIRDLTVLLLRSARRGGLLRVRAQRTAGHRLAFLEVEHL